MKITNWALTGWALTGWTTAALVLMVAGILLAAGWSDAGLHLVVRSTAQTSFVLFLLAFTASSTVRLWPSLPTRWVLRNRRYIGVGFAVSHLLHLDALVGLAIAFPEPFVGDLDALAVLGGGLAYAFIAAMALTSSDRAQARLGMRRWRQLHLAGSYIIWIVFAQSYLGRAATDPLYIPFGLAVLGALALRLAPRLRDSRSKKVRARGAPDPGSVGDGQSPIRAP